MDPDKFEQLANDPVFVDAARKLVRSRQKLNDSMPMQAEDKVVRGMTGNKYGRGDIDAWLSQAAKPSFQNVLQAAGQGIDFGFTDELRGKHMAAKAKAAGASDEDATAAGNAARDAMRLQEGQFAEQNPALHDTAKMEAGLLNPINLGLMAATGGGEAAGLPFLTRLGMRIGGGGGEGALYGAGEGTNDASRAAGIKSGAITGTIGAVAPDAALGAARVARATLAGPATRAADAAAREAVARGGKQALIDQAQRIAGTGIEPVLGDVLPASQKLAANLDPATAEQTRAIVKLRQSMSPMAGQTALQENLPEGVGTDFGFKLQDMEAERAAEFDPRYAAIDARNTQIGASPEAVLGGKPTARQILSNGKSDPLYNDAAAAVANDPSSIDAELPNAPVRPPDPVYAPLARLIKQDPEVQTAWNAVLRSAKGGADPDMARPSMSMLRNMRGKLQDRVNNMFMQGANHDAYQLKSAIQVLDNTMDLESGGALKSVNSDYRAAMDSQRALESGRQWWNAQSIQDIPNSIAGLKAMVANFSPQELESFRTGVASSIKGDLEHAQLNRSMPNEMQNMSDYKHELVSTLFDHGHQLDQYMSRVDALADAAALKNSISGSQTAGLTAGMEGSDPTGLNVSDAMHPVTAVKKVMDAAASPAGAPTVKQQFGAAMGNLTMTRGTPAIQAALDNLLKPPGAVPKFLADPVAGAAMGGAAADQGTSP